MGKPGPSTGVNKKKRKQGRMTLIEEESGTGAPKVIVYPPTPNLSTINFKVKNREEDQLENTHEIVRDRQGQPGSEQNRIYLQVPDQIKISKPLSHSLEAQQSDSINPLSPATQPQRRISQVFPRRFSKLPHLPQLQQMEHGTHIVGANSHQKPSIAKPNQNQPETLSEYSDKPSRPKDPIVNPHLPGDNRPQMVSGLLSKENPKVGISLPPNASNLAITTSNTGEVGETTSSSLKQIQHDILGDSVSIALEHLEALAPNTEPLKTEGGIQIAQGPIHLQLSHSQKRGREGDGGPGELGDKQDEVDETVEHQRPLKKSKLDLIQANLNTKDVMSIPLQAVDFTSAAHPLGDRSDDWFEIAFTRCQQRTLRWAQVYFGFRDISTEPEFARPWSIKMTPEFLKEVEKVAVADLHYGGWGMLLLDSMQRTSLIAAIIDNFFQNNIFDEDLFGATKEEKEALHAMDKALIADGGFHRTFVRSHMIRTMMDQRDSVVTKNFESEVCRLTAQIYLLFEPLTRYLHSTTALKKEAIPRLEDHWQDLHDLVANTAFLSICIRSSADIFHFIQASPGETCDPEYFMLLDKEVLQKSKSAALAAHKAKMDALPERDSAIPIQLLHLIKISVFPYIECFKLGSGNPGEEEEGFRIHELRKGTVIAYYGQRKSEDPNYVSLQAFLGESS
ncbi:hypothetical protein B7463_g9690, partial [Scytalidium lignicola]